MTTLRLSILLRDMEIPASRRDTTKPENLRWLLRNLRIRNLENPSISEAIALLKKEIDKLQ
jgi:hypothetical protein